MERPFLGKRRDMAPHTHFTENGKICRVTTYLLHYQIQIPMSGTSKKAKINIFTLQSEGPSFQTTPFDISFFFELLILAFMAKT